MGLLAGPLLAIVGLVAGQHLISVVGFALLVLEAGDPALRPLVIAPCAVLLAWLASGGPGRLLDAAPETMRAAGAAGGAAWVAILAAAAVLLAWAAARSAGPGRSDTARGYAGDMLRSAAPPVGAALVGIAALSALILVTTTFARSADGAWHYRPEADYPVRRVPGDWADVQRWVAEHTPKDAFVLNPPYLEGFRTHARRSQFVDWKQGTLSMFHEDFGTEWLRRMQRLVTRQLDPSAWRNVALNYETMPAQQLEGIVREYGLTHVVTGATQSQRPLPWREVYSNGTFRVVETGAIPPSSRR